MNLVEVFIARHRFFGIDSSGYITEHFPGDSKRTFELAYQAELGSIMIYINGERLNEGNINGGFLYKQRLSHVILDNMCPAFCTMTFRYKRDKDYTYSRRTV